MNLEEREENMCGIMSYGRCIRCGKKMMHKRRRGRKRGMKMYKVTAKQEYYVEADTPEEAKTFFIFDDEHVGVGFMVVTDIEEVQDDN